MVGKRVSPHTIRHYGAMMICQATKDPREVALWLGHANTQTAETYLRADPTEKLVAIEAGYHHHFAEVNSRSHIY